MASREPAAQVARSRDKDFYAALGRAIRVTRTEQGLERKELARLTGLSYPYLSEIEKGKKRASTEALLPIARALGLRQSELLERAERLLELGLSRSDLAPTPRRRTRQSRELARVYRLAPARAEAACQGGVPELLARSRPLG